MLISYQFSTRVIYIINKMITVRTKTGWKTVSTGQDLKREREEQQCKERCHIICLVIMTFSFVAIKISLFVMIGKFIFQNEDNLFGFPVKMFSFTETYWVRQEPEVNFTEK